MVVGLMLFQLQVLRLKHKMWLLLYFVAIVCYNVLLTHTTTCSFDC